MTLIEKLDKDEEYQGVKREYERLCEYLHPNLLSNFDLTEAVVKDGSTHIRVHRKGEYVIARCLRNTAELMAAWTDATIQAMNSIEWPFGQPSWKSDNAGNGSMTIQ